MEWVTLDPENLPPEQKKMVVQYKLTETTGGCLTFGMNIEGTFCEYHPDIDRMVEQEGLWKHILRYVIIEE